MVRDGHAKFGARALMAFARRGLTAACVVWLVMVSGCTNVSFFIRTDEDEQAEERYKAVYTERILRIHENFELFAPSGSNPGVCNVGGSKQGCYDADAIAIDDLQAMLRAMEEIPVPPRYAEGDRLLREALRGNIRGLELRNKAIAENDQAAWDEHQAALRESTPLFLQAWEAFPVDNRPQPPP